MPNGSISRSLTSQATGASPRRGRRNRHRLLHRGQVATTSITPWSKTAGAGGIRSMRLGMQSWNDWGTKRHEWGKSRQNRGPHWDEWTPLQMGPILKRRPGGISGMDSEYFFLNAAGGAYISPRIGMPDRRLG